MQVPLPRLSRRYRPLFTTETHAVGCMNREILISRTDRRPSSVMAWMIADTGTWLHRPAQRVGAENQPGVNLRVDARRSRLRHRLRHDDLRLRAQHRSHRFGRLADAGPAAGPPRCGASVGAGRMGGFALPAWDPHCWQRWPVGDGGSDDWANPGVGLGGPDDDRGR